MAMRYIASLAEQGMGAIIAFGINLWLIRNDASASYGVYVFWYAVAWVLATCQSTLTLVHLSALPSGPERMAERREPERVLFTVTLIIQLLATLGVLVANGILSRAGSNLNEPAAALFIPAFLFYQFVRAFAFSRRCAVLSAILTGAVLLTAAIGLGADFLAGARPDAARVLVIVGTAYGVCSLAVLWVLERGIRPVVRLSGLRPYAHYLLGSGWMMLGAASGEITSRLYSFMVVGWFGTAALASLSAVQVVIRPAWMLSSAWSSVGFPAMASQRGAGDHRGMIDTALRGVAMASAGSILWSGIVIAAWPWISSTLYRGQYPEIGMLGWFWGGNVLLGSIAVPLNIAMLVLGQFRSLALLDLVAAAVCSGSMVVLLSHFGYPSSIVGTMIGQAAQILMMAAALSRRLRTRHPLGARGATGPVAVQGAGGNAPSR